MEVSGHCGNLIAPVGWEGAEEGVEIVGDDVVEADVEFWGFVVGGFVFAFYSFDDRVHGRKRVAAG